MLPKTKEILAKRQGRPILITLQLSSVSQSCPTLCDPINRSTPGLPVHHQLLEFTQTHVHRVGDAIQPSHPLSSPSPPAPNPSQHQSLAPVKGHQEIFPLGLRAQGNRKINIVNSLVKWILIRDFQEARIQ